MGSRDFVGRVWEAPRASASGYERQRRRPGYRGKCTVVILFGFLGGVHHVPGEVRDEAAKYVAKYEEGLDVS